SYVYAGNAQTLDHVLVNEALIAGAAGLQVEHARINADFGVDNFGDAAVALGTSDHDPVRLAIRVPAFRSADLAVTASASAASVRVGETATFHATVGNAGPGAAEQAAVAFVFDALLSPSITGAAGWTCAAPVPDATSTTIACTTPSLAFDASAAFVITVAAPALPDGTPLRMAVAARSQTADPANGNNQAVAEVTVVSAADLSVRLLGSAAKLRQGALATFLVPVTNAGPQAAAQPTLVLEGNVAANLAAVAAPTGWSCSPVGDTAEGFRAECARDGAMVPGTQWFAFAIVVPKRPRKGELLEFIASVAAQTADPDLANNGATLGVEVTGGKPAKPRR
ncbi:MAG: CARDB domain-containing protein, partial [Lysobacter sp.]